MTGEQRSWGGAGACQRRPAAAIPGAPPISCGPTPERAARAFGAPNAAARLGLHGRAARL